MLALLLMVCGSALFVYKAWRIGLPLAPGEKIQVWTVEARISFRPNGGPVKATLRLPRKPPGFGILNENFISRGYGLSTLDTGAGREAQWTIRRARGTQALYYRVVVYADNSMPGDESVPPFPAVPELEEPFATALEQIVSDARQRSADVASFAAAVLSRLGQSDPDEYVQLFAGATGNSIERARAAQTLLAGARIPSRIVSGIRLGEQIRQAPIEHWLQVHNGDRWLFFHPTTGQQFRPESLLIWWRGSEPLAVVDGARDVETILSVRRNIANSVEVAERRAMTLDSNAVRFSLLSLPIRTQAVFGVLLLVPIGALVLVVMRNVIGIPTFGTFTPVLVALAFRETHLVNGVLLFSFVVALGLAVRFYLERLRLLLVPRLASVLIVVVLMLVGIGILSHRMGLETGLSVALFPMVILTMVIERMSIVWEERGASAAMKEGVGSLVVAVVAYLAMSTETLEHLVFVFPELMLVLLGVTLLMGRYAGYRLTELMRFREMGQAGS